MQMEILVPKEFHNYSRSMGDSGGQHITVGSVPYPLPGSKTEVQRRAAALPVRKPWAQSQDMGKKNPRGLRSEEIPL